MFKAILSTGLGVLLTWNPHHMAVYGCDFVKEPGKVRFDLWIISKILVSNFVGFVIKVLFYGAEIL